MINSAGLMSMWVSGKPNIDARLLNPANFNDVSTAAECCAVIKHAIEMAKGDEYMSEALRLVLRFISTKPTAAIELGDQGICSQIDTILGLKVMSCALCELCLEVVASLLATRGPSSGAPVSQRSTIFAAVVGMVASSDESANKKRLTSSSTIFRIIKACHTHCAQVDILLTGLRLFSTMISQADDSASKLVSCGVCDLLGLVLKTHSAHPELVVLTCQCVDDLLSFDLEDANGSLGCQDKFSDQFMCEMLVGKVLQAKLNPTVGAAAAALRAVGSLARRHQGNKERLAACGACEAIPELCQPTFLADSDFASRVCWCFANLSFPNDDNQKRLAAAGACEIVLSILNQHGNDVELVQEGCRAIHQVAEMHDDNLLRLKALGAARVCMELLERYNSSGDVLQWVMFALATLTGLPENLDELHQLGICDRIVDLSSRFVANEDLVQWAAVVTANLCQNTLLASHLHGAHCCQVLLQNLGHHLPNPDVCEEVLRAMGALAAALVDSRQTLSDNSVAEFILRALEQHADQETVCEQGLYALACVLQLSRESLSTAQIAMMGRTEQRLFMAVTYSCLTSSGLGLVSTILVKFSSQNTTLALYGAQFMTSLVLGSMLLDARAPTSSGQESESLALAKLGSSGAASALCSMLSSHIQDSMLVFWCMFGCSHLAAVPSNQALLSGADVCALANSVLSIHITSRDIVCLALELVMHLCEDASCRLVLGSVLTRADGSQAVVQTMLHHAAAGDVLEAGCRAISALCIAPSEDALSSLFARETDRQVKLPTAPEEEVVRPRRTSGTGSTDWATFNETVDHMNSVIEEDNHAEDRAASAASAPSPDAAAPTSRFLRRLSVSMPWVSRAENAETTPPTTVISKPAISAMYDQSQHTGPTQARGGIGQQFIMNAANSIISKGLSDQEERAILAMKQRATQRKANSDLLADGGALHVIKKILATDSSEGFSRAVKAQALNALNSLCLFAPNRARTRELGLLETLAEVHACAVRAFSGENVRDFPGLNTSALVDADWDRIIVLLVSIAIGTCCLSQVVAADKDTSKTAQQLASLRLSQDTLGALGVISVLTSSLAKASTDMRVCEVVLRALYLLVTNNDGNQALVALPVTDAGAAEGKQCAITHVVRVLTAQLEAPRIAYYACLSIASMAADRQQNCILLNDCAVCPVVLRTLALYMDHDEVVEAACQAIHGLKPLNVVLGQAGACEHIVQALSVHTNSAVVSEWVCRAIGSLAECEFNKIELEKHHITKIVTAVLQKHVSSDNFITAAFSKDRSSAGVAQWGCTAIYYLAKGYDAEGFQRRLVAAGACEAVARALMKYAEVEAVAYACCRALVVLVDRNEALRSKPFLANVCQYIVESLHLFPSSVLVAKWGCRAVAVLAESHEANIAKLGAAGACESIPLIIQSHPSSEEVAVAGCKAIAFMSEHTENGFAARFGQAGACEAVVGALKKHISSPVAVARASIAINMLALVQGNARWFGPAGACDTLHAALSLHMPSHEVAKFVVSAIGQLCVIDHNKERLGILGTCEVVVQTAQLHVQDRDAAQSCADTIGKLCEVLNKPMPAAKAQAFDRDEVITDPHFLAGRRNRAVLLHSGACRVLVEALDHHLADAMAAPCVCKAIFILAQVGDICNRERDELGRLGACQAVTKALLLHEGSQEVVVFACLAMQSLAVDCAPNQQAFHAAGACPLVVQALRGYRHAQSLVPTEAAARAICGLAAGCPENKAALGGSGACEGLLENLELNARAADLTLLLLKALFHVCDGVAANRVRMSFTGAPDILYNLLVRYGDEEKVVDYALSVMIGLALDKVGQSKLGSVGVLKTLVALMGRYDKSEHVLALVLALLGALCRQSKPNQDKCSQVSVAKVLAAVLLKHAAAVSPTAAKVNVDGGAAGKVMRAEAGEASETSIDASTSLVSYLGEVSVVKESCRAVYFFCADNEANRLRLVSLGVMDVLTALVSSALLADDTPGELSDKTKWWARAAMEVLMRSCA